MTRMSRTAIAAVAVAAALASTVHAGERAPRASGTTVAIVTADAPAGPRAARAGSEAGSVAVANPADAPRRPRAGGYPWFVGNDPDARFETLLDEPVVARRPRAGGVTGQVWIPEIEIGARRAKAGEAAPATGFASADPAPRRPRAGGGTEPALVTVETAVVAAFE